MQVVLIVRSQQYRNRAALMAAVGLAILIFGARLARAHASLLTPGPRTDGSPRTGAEVSVGSVAFGVLADWAGTYAYSALLASMGPLWLMMSGASAEETPKLFEQIAGDKLAIVLVFLPVGFFFTGVGGFMASRVSSSKSLLNAALVGSAGLLLSLMFMSQNPLWVNYAAVLGSVPAAMIGGLVHTRRLRFF